MTFSASPVVSLLLRGAAAATVVLALFACSDDSDELGGGGGDADAGPQIQPTVQNGKTLVEQTYKCTVCHGANMAGSTTPLAKHLPTNKLYPPNLTPDQATGVGSWSDDQLKVAIREGVDKDGQILCPQMKHYDTMPDDQLAAIVAYLRSLPAVSNEVPDSVCPPLKVEE